MFLANATPVPVEVNPPAIVRPTTKNISGHAFLSCRYPGGAKIVPADSAVYITRKTGVQCNLVLSKDRLKKLGIKG